MTIIPKLLLISGSARTGSFNQRLVQLAGRKAQALGAQVTPVDLRALNLPVYDDDLLAREGMPAGALAGGYCGVTAGASLGVGMGANVLVGGLKRSFTLQPISMDGMQGTNLALGVASVSLWVPKQN